MSASLRPSRVPKPSGEVLANQTPKGVAKVSKRSASRGGGRGGKRVQAAARGKALADLIDISSSGSHSSSEEGEEGAEGATGSTPPKGVDEDEPNVVSEDGVESGPAVFTYVAQWKILCKKEKLKSTIRRYKSDLMATPITEAMAWINEEARARAKNKGSHERESKAHQFSFTFNKNGKAVPSKGHGAPTSSPVEMPASQSSSLELREQFFTWCKTQTSWRGKRMAMDEMAAVFAANGYSVKGIGTADAAE
ncbi:hypothetical protein B0A48_18662 [Cryoendolithus antarcticus]|uniref:Uncharacterized protein n=1 Tax=Cryoendolithus antarcticus TaxID=1507870 RepID=A0A1V8S886_9PEZI|nr:hypothetical protein B0A48_18662 [Cryoendolithus antarcticus]